MKHVIDNIKSISVQRGFSHEYVTLELDMSQAAYCKIESMKTRLSVRHLYKLAEIFEVPVSHLISNETDKMTLSLSRSDTKSITR
jgi:transcriptional regulator with XRE-family HTH domain